LEEDAAEKKRERGAIHRLGPAHHSGRPKRPTVLPAGRFLI
jgi:hypothetical protein